MTADGALELRGKKERDHSIVSASSQRSSAMGVGGLKLPLLCEVSITQWRARHYSDIEIQYLAVK